MTAYGWNQTDYRMESFGRFIGFSLALCIFVSVAFYITGRVGLHMPRWHNYWRVLVAAVGLHVFYLAVRSFKK